jgi:mRNA-degrading endonuclease RelE of RelBE toxin-antitoxin system
MANAGQCCAGANGGGWADLREPIALRGKEFRNFWKCRVGDWRIIADIEDRVLLITVVRLGNRREVYRR